MGKDSRSTTSKDDQMANAASSRRYGASCGVESWRRKPYTVGPGRGLAVAFGF
jgi:hypothetical protein